MLKMKSHYRINELFMYMAGFYDRNGKQCTFVKEVNQTFLVDQSPLEILNYSIQCIGFDLRGALSTSKWILGDQIHMRPVIVNPIMKITLFPTKSSKHPENIWFNPSYINRTSNSMRNTIVHFSNGEKLKVDSLLCAFNHKLQIAEQLSNLTSEAAAHPTTFFLDPKGRKKKKCKK